VSNLKVAVSQDFMLAFSKVPKSAQKKVMEFMSKFRQDPQSSGINYEKINDARDENYRSVRIDQKYRGIILKPASGNVFLLLWVDKHDDAYDWARRHKCQVNPNTGSLQIFAASTAIGVETSEVLDSDHGPVPEENPPVASGHPAEPGEASQTSPEKQNEYLTSLSEAQYLALGVPGELLPLVQAVRTEEALEKIESCLPVEAYEALYLLAAGTSWHDIERDYIHKPTTGIDTDDIAAALNRPESQRSFHVVGDELELIEMLKAPLERWRVFLHPSQNRLANRHWNGPVRVLGGAGTGKTVVAMHRARWLVKNLLQGDDKKILFTTFTANLATDIKANLSKICTPDEMQRIEVKHIDSWVNEFLRKQRYASDIVYFDSNRYGSRDGEFKTIWKEALQLTDAELEFPDSFYEEEWKRIILPQRVFTWADYSKARRIGRGVSLSRKQRAGIWPVFEEVRSRLQRKGLRTFEDATLDAADILAASDVHLPYRCVIVDEAQDMGPEVLTLIRRLVPEQADDIFVVGDGHQRIYGRKAVMSQCGIKIVGRSRKLRVNYRTTEQIRRCATAVLENVQIDDLDGELDSSHDYRSLTQGPDPEIVFFPDKQQEQGHLVDRIKALHNEGVLLKDLCVVARTRHRRDDYGDALNEAGLDYVPLDQKNDDREVDGVRLATMHRVKGLEFRYIFIVSANDGVLPLSVARNSTVDPVESRQIDAGERALLHVAMTRAIKGLHISGYGSPSPYLKGLVASRE
jgi:superfamily I DNA/RNA helicase